MDDFLHRSFWRTDAEPPGEFSQRETPFLSEHSQLAADFVLQERLSLEPDFFFTTKLANKALQDNSRWPTSFARHIFHKVICSGHGRPPAAVPELGRWASCDAFFDLWT